jgi:hypothetical protein
MHRPQAMNARLRRPAFRVMISAMLLLRTIGFFAAFTVAGSHVARA